MAAANRRVETALSDLERNTSVKGLVAAARQAQASFTPYMSAQCKLVQASYASGGGAGQAGLACEVDLLRARTAELKRLAPEPAPKN
jgi:uncharacterized protein YecT (DUF1311 family)